MFSGISNWSWPSGVPRALFKHCSKYFWYRHLSCSTSKHQHSQFRIQSIFQTGSRFAQDNKSPNSFDPIAHSWWWKLARERSKRSQSKFIEFFCSKTTQNAFFYFRKNISMPSMTWQLEVPVLAMVMQKGVCQINLRMLIFQEWSMANVIANTTLWVLIVNCVLKITTMCLGCQPLEIRETNAKVRRSIEIFYVKYII